VRRPLSVSAALAVAVSLAACAAIPEPSPTPSGSEDPVVALTCADSGATSESIHVAGEFGSEPTVFFDSPISVDQTERSVAIEGTGDVVAFGDTVSISFSLYNGTTGELSTATSYGASGALIVTADPARLLPGFVSALLCSGEGARVVGAVAPGDAFGSAGQADLGIEPGTTLVFVADVVDIVGDQAEGEAQPPLEAPFPEIRYAADGQPTVTIPETDPPATLAVGLVIKGEGLVVGDDDEFTIHYQGINWNTGEVFDQSWDGAPRSFTSVIPGFRKAIVGQTVGSRVVVIIPPAEGYGETGNSSAGIAPDDTLVFVIDILATAPPS
jgi:FKBP-type peptidyl-prolyl cis-trans isomerase